jgi:isoquinoline 1-oxidoreductase subunit beta
MSASPKLNRRGFLVLAGATGLVLGVGTLFIEKEVSEHGVNVFNPWLSIDSDGSVTLFCGRSEMGQGIFTGLGQLVAEELECDLQKLKVETGPADRAFINLYTTMDLLTDGHAEQGPTGAYKNGLLAAVAKNASMQVTGASTSMRDGFFRLRQVGATARVMLVQAAAQEWRVLPGECVVEAGVVRHAPSGRQRNYGELAAAAAKLEPPDHVPLKLSSAWKLIGKKMPRLDVPSKTDGSAVYGIDVRRPNMLFAAVANCPVFGGKLKQFDATAALKLPGVKTIEAVPGGLAVVADTTWHAKQGLRAVTIDWENGPNVNLDSATLEKQYLASLDGSLRSIAKFGAVDEAMRTANKTVTAEYRLPFLAHAPMEPMNCTAEVTPDGVDVWAPCQNQTRSQTVAAKAADVSATKVRIHTTLLGGGFGRRGEADFVAQAVTLANIVRQPVQVIWSREEDMQHDFYRPMEVSRLTAGLDEQGMPVAWQQHVAASSIFARVFPPVVWMKGDPAIAEGAANLSYAIPNRAMASSTQPSLVPVGYWRSVGNSQNAFFKECFLDEIAVAGGIDPVELRRRLLGGQPRMLAVLERAAREADWGKPLPPGQGRGVALHPSSGSIVAEIAEVAVESGRISVKRVVAVIDCGLVITPDSVETQVQGSIVFGMTAALFGKITVEKGQVVQSNFPDYNMVRMAQMPKIEVHIISSNALPGGVGQPATAPIAPAMINAIFAATGKRVRSLPLIDQGFTVT